MMAIYKTRCPGPYHIKNGIPCQDSYAYKILGNEYIVTAVADGLGSCKHSDVGAKVAADSAIAVCSGKLECNMSDEEIIEIMKLAYMVADANVSSTAEKAGDMCDEYDTTLCLAIYDGKNLYYGQAGDSGLIALTHTGEYIPVTSQQRDEYGAVYPLCFGLNYWEFGKVEGDVSGYALMTDGIWEQLFPPLLKEEEVRINVPLAEKMINYFEVEENEILDLEKMMSDYWENCPKKFIDDDKTSVCVINTDFVPLRKSDDYYKEPDWVSLKEKAHKEREKRIRRTFETKGGSDDDAREINDSSDERINSRTEDNTDETVFEFVQLAKASISKGVERVKEVFKEEKLEIPHNRKSMEEAVEQFKQRTDKQKAENDDNEVDGKTNMQKKSTALPIHIDIRM